MKQDRLEIQEIQKELHPFFHTVEIVEETTSTNDVIKEKANHLKEGYVFIADAQNKGKGRNGRTFYSPGNSGIYMSFLLKPDLSIYESLKLTACVSVAVYEAIHNLYEIETEIKWVNDLFLHDHKIAGILCEASLQANSTKLDYMVVGIGINVHEYLIPEELQSIAASIEQFTSITHSRNTLIKEILNCFYTHYAQFDTSDFLSIYRKHSYVIGKEVNVINNQKTYTATVLEIDENAFLTIQKEDGSVETLSSGEISIRVK